MVRIGRVWHPLCSEVSLSPSVHSVIMQGSPGCEFWPCFWTWISLLSAWDPAAWHRLSGMQALSPPEPPRCPQEGRGVFPLLPRLAQQHVANRTELKMNQQVSASLTSLHWDHVHPGTNSLLPKPALLFAGALGRRVASGIVIPLEADAAFPGFDADRQ